MPSSKSMRGSAKRRSGKLTKHQRRMINMRNIAGKKRKQAGCDASENESLRRRVAKLEETVEELKADHPGLPAVLDAIETSCNVLFMVEFALRLLSAPSYREFGRNALNYVHLVAVLPFYLDMFPSPEAGSGLAVVKIVRLSRVHQRVLHHLLD